MTLHVPPLVCTESEPMRTKTCIAAQSLAQQPGRSCRLPVAARPLTRSSVVITTVNLLTHYGEVALRGIKRIGLARKPEGGDLHFRLHLARRMGAHEPEMLRGFLVFHWFAG